MAVEMKHGLSNSHKLFLRCLVLANGVKNIDEIQKDYDKATGKVGKPGSAATNLSTLKKQLAYDGIPFNKAWEPKRKEGGGRTSVRTNTADFLNSLGIDFSVDNDAEGDDSEGETEAAE